MVVAVLVGSVRAGRMADRVGKWVVAQLQARGHEAVVVDPLLLNLPLLNKMWKEVKAELAGPEAELRDQLAPLAALYDRADGFAVVSGEYNHSIPPALSNLLDYFLEEYFYRPSAIVCYSSTPFGGVRAAMQLRALLPEIGMPPIPSIQPIPSVETALSEDGVALTQELAERSGKFFDEFEWYMTALKLGREKNDPRKTTPGDGK